MLAVGACGSQTDLAEDRAHTLQVDVLAVSTAAAAKKWDAVESALTAARKQLDAGLDAGEISTSRYHEIDAALDRVAAEVAAAEDRAAAAAVAKAKSEAAAKVKATATASPSADSTSVPTAKAPSAPKAGNKGKGADNGKGPGSKHPPHPKKDK
ncbi:hypothetical protein D1825_07455 [Cellulomonas rhizosphaerae]|uniref:Mucin-associated surface protein n=1 Tax=Cellulomonas rhizosphaerae TaxID=2293719 RepID=A0A413RML4_9CELL|nr:hypothetical protein D1825_07455 [Cellulomonas rhizosphaerae]